MQVTGRPRAEGIPPEGAGMFVLAEMQDVIRIEPHQFKFDMQRQIEEELNKKLANKVHSPVNCMRPCPRYTYFLTSSTYPCPVVGHFTFMCLVIA